MRNKAHWLLEFRRQFSVIDIVPCDHSSIFSSTDNGIKLLLVSGITSSSGITRIGKCEGISKDCISK